MNTLLLLFQVIAQIAVGQINTNVDQKLTWVSVPPDNDSIEMSLDTSQNANAQTTFTIALEERLDQDDKTVREISSGTRPGGPIFEEKGATSNSLVSIQSLPDVGKAREVRLVVRTNTGRFDSAGGYIKPTKAGR